MVKAYASAAHNPIILPIRAVSSQTTASTDNTVEALRAPWSTEMHDGCPGSVSRTDHLRGRGSSIREATHRTFVGKQVHPRRGIPSVACGTPYATKHAARCVSR